MNKKLISILSAVAISAMSLTAVTTSALTEVEHGKVTITVVDENTMELFDEKLGKFSIMGSPLEMMEGAGGATYLGGWKVAEQNPCTFENAQINSKYTIQHTGRSYNGYSYYIDESLCSPMFNFIDGNEQNVVIYMKKSDWGEPVETSFEELREMDEESLKSYCNLNNLKYVSPEEVQADLGHGGKLSIRMKPSGFAVDGVEDVCCAENISDIDRHNFSDYSVAKMIKSLNVNEEYYNITLDEREFAVCNERVFIPETETAESRFVKLASLDVEIDDYYKKNLSDEEIIRLHQLIRIQPDLDVNFHSYSVQYSGYVASEKEFVEGDANGDGKFNIADVVRLQKWLLGMTETIDVNGADVYQDGEIDVFDLCLLRKMVVHLDVPQTPSSPTQPLTSPLSFDTVEKAVEGIINYDYQDESDVYRDSQKAMYDKFNETGYLYKVITDDVITSYDDRGISLLPYAKYEDVGVINAVKYKGNAYVLFFYRYDDNFAEESANITDYIKARFNGTFDRDFYIDGRFTAIRTTETENQPTLVHSYSAIDDAYYLKAHTTASEEDLVEFLNALAYEKVEIK